MKKGPILLENESQETTQKQHLKLIFLIVQSISFLVMYAKSRFHKGFNTQKLDMNREVLYNLI